MKGLPAKRLTQEQEKTITCAGSNRDSFILWFDSHRDDEGFFIIGEKRSTESEILSAAGTAGFTLWVYEDSRYETCRLQFGDTSEVSVVYLDQRTEMEEKIPILI